MDFRIRQLQCFLTLADLLNYGKTARALYMSQPTISFQIKTLEESFGAKLFDRDRQRVRLTEAGLAFREYAQTIVDTVEAARERLGGLNSRLQLRLSCGPVGQFILLPARRQHRRPPDGQRNADKRNALRPDLPRAARRRRLPRQPARATPQHLCPRPARALPHRLPP